MTPNDVFLLFVAGMLAVYAADLFPSVGFIRFPALGAVVAAVYFAPSYPIRFAGLMCVLAAFALFAIDFWTSINYVAGCVATILLPIGFLLLYSGPHRLDTQLAIWLGFMLSSTTATYSWRAKRARLNKLADL